MSTPSNSGLRRLVECDKRNSPLPSLSNAPTVGDTASEAQADEPLAVQADFPNDGDDDDDDNYNGLDFKRVPYLERRQVERNSRGGPKAGSTATAGPSGTASTRKLLALPVLPSTTEAGGLLRG
ncbi:hypothetical protein P3342_004860 [Pyrenophora teres f. teres]|nr:hypothetical protein P3342_004860 [Pyrenophora teres f. teres]